MYATRSNSVPTRVSANGIGNGSAGNTGNFANYGSNATWNGAIGNITSVGTNGSSSYFGTQDQSGNTWEWNDSIIQSTNRGILGGSYNTSIASDLSSISRKFAAPNSGAINYGFRVCSKYPIPEGNTLIEFVPVLEQNNPANSTGYGSVSYSYCISRYPITNSQYAQFLLSIEGADSYSAYVSTMASNIRGGINSDYTVKANMGNKPVNYITWFRAARFVNWLHNGMVSGPQSSLTTESGVYTLNGANSGVSFAKNPDANYWIPSEDEWYKAAYYLPTV
jgi:formylglycine-generating enzyme required for sulfatase activity